MMHYLLSFGAVLSTLLVGVMILGFIAADRRHPIDKEKKLLREVGHSLREKITRYDRALPGQILMFILIGISPLMNIARDASSDPLDRETTSLRWMTFSILLATMAGVLWSVISHARQRRNLTLGLLGERIVAEHLEPLKATGHRVFHDLPAGDPPTSHKTPYNIDHIVVGPAGVFAIETKTRRQGRTRVGVMAHEIIFDGRALAFPWGEDQHGLDQARRQAEWLAEFLQRELGRPVPVHALLVFPGWTIIRKDGGATNAVHVLSPRELPAAIEGRPASGHTGFVVPPLDATAIEDVSRHLEARCRDVEL